MWKTSAPRARLARRRRLDSFGRLAAGVLPLLGVTLSAGPAHADGEVNPAPAIPFLIGATTATLGVVTDTGIGVQLASGGGVSRAWSITGTVAWSLTTLCAVPIVAEAHELANTPGANRDRVVEAFGFAYTTLAVSLASESLSIYALTRPPPAPRGSPAPAFWLSVPSVSPRQGGAVVSLRGRF